MKQDFVRIAHLSDLHFSTDNKDGSCYEAEVLCDNEVKG